MLKANLRGLLARKLRLTLAVIAIVLGVGFFSGAFVLSDTLGSRFESMFATVNANVAVEVTTTEQAGQRVPAPTLTDADLARIGAVDGVAAIAGDVSQPGVIPFHTQTGKALTTGGAPQLGTGLTGDEPLGLMTLAEGRWPRAPGEVALSRFTADQVKAAVGQPLKIFVGPAAKTVQATVVGVTEFTGDRDSIGGETIVVFPRAEAQELFFGQTGRYNSASLGARDGVTHTALRDRVGQVLPPDFEAKTGEQSAEEQAQGVSEAVSGLTTYVLVPFAGVAVVVGIFLIFNTFNVLVAQRARELALMRALGAGRGQVTTSVLVEALIVGVVGATVGLGLGIAIGWGGSTLLATLGSAQLPGGGVTVGPVAVVGSYAIGVGATLIAALLPAVRGSRVPPLAAMRDIAVTDKPLRLRAAFGLVLAAGAAALLVLGLRDDDGGLSTVAAGCGVAFLAALVLAPLATRPVGRAVGLLVGWGVSGDLGVRNAVRNPRRTAVTASALMIGVMLVSAAGVVATSFRNTVTESLRSSVTAELIASVGFGQPPDGRVGFSADAVGKIRQLPEVQDVVTFHTSLPAKLNGTPYESIAVSAVDDLGAAARTMGLTAVGGRVGPLARGELLMDEKTARDQGWRVGDSITVNLPRGDTAYRVVGLFESTPMWTNNVLLPMEAVAAFAGPLAAQAVIDLRDGADSPAVQRRIETIMQDFPTVTVSDQSALVGQVDAVIDIALLIIAVLLGLAMLIALLGILNTLLLSIVERTRELGMLRAIGLSRRSLIRMIGTEAVLMSVFGGLLGVAVGVGIGAAVSESLVGEEFLTGVWIPWWQMALLLVAAAVAGVFAALIPAWRAARLNVLEAIAYE